MTGEDYAGGASIVCSDCAFFTLSNSVLQDSKANLGGCLYITQTESKKVKSET